MRVEVVHRQRDPVRAGDRINGRASLPPEMAIRLEKAFAVSKDMLLRLQAWYDAARTRARAGVIHVRRHETA